MTYHFTVTQRHEHAKLSVFLRDSGISLALIKKIKFLPDGILVNGQKQNTNYRVSTGDKVLINTTDEGEESTVIPQHGLLDIVYQDECCMVVNKPYDMPCHPSFNHPTDTVANYFVGYWQARGENKICRIINRLDRNTSGLVLIALDAHTAEQFKGKVDKTYTAIITGQMEQADGIIDLPIARQRESIITRCVSPQGQRAVTEYTTVKTNGEMSVLNIKLHTGRTHQIRVHFSHLGHPLQGDDLYGGSMDNIQRHALHCSQLVFYSPCKAEMVKVTSLLPPDMEELASKIN